LAFLEILRKQNISKEKEEKEKERRKIIEHQTPIKFAFANLMNEIYARSCGMHVRA
jgi:hypothetical protein